MSHRATLEREVKFEVPLGLALPDMRAVVGQTFRLPQEQLVTIYFDTSDRRLWRQGLTLRCRTTQDGGDETWTLKLPANSRGQSLERTEVTWSAPAGQVPQDAVDALQGVIRRVPLRQIVSLETTRRRLVLRDRGERPLGELDDDLVRVVGGHRDGHRFRQVELEFIDHGWKGRKVIRRLEKAGAQPVNAPKIALAVDLPGRRQEDPSLNDKTSVAGVIQATIRASFDRLLAHDWRLRLAVSQPSPADVHQARVATRRLRSNLKAFDVLDPVWSTHVRDDLKWLGTALGGVRDADVLGEEMGHIPPELEQRLDAERAAAVRELAIVMDSHRYMDLLDKLHASTQLLPLAEGGERTAERPAREVLPSMVGRRWRAMRRQVRRAGSHPSAQELHRIRIKSKHLRYAAEVATPVMGKPAKRTAARAEHVQTVLGRHHDAGAREHWLREGLAARSVWSLMSSVAAFEAGLLAADARRQRRRARREWVDAWKSLAKPKDRHWMREQ